MTAPQSIRVFIPDAGPLISLAIADELNLLLTVAEDVRIVITDHVQWEVTRRSDLPDTDRIAAFLDSNAGRVEVVETTIGKMAKLAMQGGGAEIKRLKDLGELSISSAMIDMRKRNPGEPTLVLIEDEWFGSHAAREGNAHLLSTSAWLDGLESVGVIESAAAIRRKILRGRANFRVDFVKDDPAPKVEGGTEWRTKFKP